MLCVRHTAHGRDSRACSSHAFACVCIYVSFHLSVFGPVSAISVTCAVFTTQNYSMNCNADGGGYEKYKPRPCVCVYVCMCVCVYVCMCASDLPSTKPKGPRHSTTKASKYKNTPKPTKKRLAGLHLSHDHDPRGFAGAVTVTHTHTYTHTHARTHTYTHQPKIRTRLGPCVTTTAV